MKPLNLCGLCLALALMLLLDACYTPHDAYFWGNFAAWWMPQVFALGITLFFRPPIGLLSGAALAYMVFATCTHFFSHGLLSWAGYLLCLPGASFGAVAASVKALISPPVNTVSATLDGFKFVAAGLAVNLFIVWFFLQTT